MWVMSPFECFISLIELNSLRWTLAQLWSGLCLYRLQYIWHCADVLHVPRQALQSHIFDSWYLSGRLILMPCVQAAVWRDAQRKGGTEWPTCLDVFFWKKSLSRHCSMTNLQGNLGKKGMAAQWAMLTGCPLLRLTSLDNIVCIYSWTPSSSTM